MSALVELDRVTYRYPGAMSDALRGVSLRIEPGELVVLVGGSGSGKSTLLRAIAGLAPHFHGGTLAGHVRVAGRDTREHGPGELGAMLGTVMQDPETQVVMGTVRAELALGLENRGASAASVARDVEEAALALGIERLLDRSTAELSGGELQRAALGAALAGRPRGLLLDEPTSQLDPVAGDELIGLLRRLGEDGELTIVLAEHRLERCLHAADRVVAMAAGRVVCDADPERFLTWALAAAPALATPAARLLDKVGLAPAAGVRHARARLRAAGRLPDPDRALGPAGRAPRAGSPASAVSLTPAERVPPAGGADPLAPAAPGGARRVTRRRWRRRTAPAEGRAGDALRLHRVWHELRDGPALLRGVSLRLRPGERVALMGRNGAGKSTLLRHAAGLMSPTRGTVDAGGRVALLAQNPNDYLVHERVGEEAPAAARDAVGLPAELGDRHPRELSGGERQRLALAVVLGIGLEPPVAPPAVLCLDEPTRGMDRDHRTRLVTLLAGLPAAVLVATHDAEFAAAFAERVVLLADGRAIADGPVAEILAGGAYFVTETARVLGGAGGALTPEQGAAVIHAGENASAGARASAGAGPGAERRPLASGRGR